MTLTGVTLPFYPGRSTWPLILFKIRGADINISWTGGEKCIVCLNTGLLTEEHIIPSSIGGRLTANIICKNCNDRFGRLIEAKLKDDPAIHLAIEHLHKRIPDIVKVISEGQFFLGQSDRGDVPGVIKKGVFQIRSKIQNDGSLIQPTHIVRKNIEKIIRKETSQEITVLDALKRFDEAKEGVEVSITKRIRVKKWGVKGIRPALGKRTINDQVLIKIAYEFIALNLGRNIYEPAFDVHRGVLLANSISTDAYRIDYLRGPRYLPFHGVGLEQVSPYVIVQIRLFGLLAFRVHFLRISIKGPRYYYTHDIENGQESIVKAV